MRTCTKCGDLREDSDFYNGHAACKPCVRARVADRYHRLMRDPVWAAQERERNRIRMIAKYHAELKHEPEHWRRHTAWNAEYRRRNPEKYRARTAVGNAVRDGVLQRPDACESCGAIGPVEAHHEDYDKPLEVRWLCALCHGKQHRRVA